MEKIVQDDLAELVKFESEEIDLDQINVNQIVSKLSENADYIENLEFENRMFAEFLSGLGYTQVQISDIAMMGAGFNQTNSGD